MIIQFTGAQSTGKTSVSDFLTQKFSWLAVRETAREIQALGLPIDKDATDFSQCYINTELLIKYVRARESSSQQNFVFDRSFICCYAYGVVANVSSILLEQTRKLIRLTSAPPYARFTFYFPPVLDFIKDGVRQAESREEVDKVIRRILEEENISYITVPVGTVAGRANFIMNTLTKQGYLL